MNYQDRFARVMAARILEGKTKLDGSDIPAVDRVVVAEMLDEIHAMLTELLAQQRRDRGRS